MDDLEDLEDSEVPDVMIYNTVVSRSSHDMAVKDNSLAEMAADQEANELSSLYHFLATPDQLSTSSSQLDAVPVDLESSIRLAGTQLTQAAGILLRLPQGIIAHAIVIFLRFFIGPQGGSVRTYAAQVRSLSSLRIRIVGKFVRDSKTTGCIGSVAIYDG